MTVSAPRPGTRRNALVVGGSRGIGRAIVERLAADGMRVTFSYVARAEAADEVERAVSAGGGVAVGRRADAADVEEMRALLDATPAGGDGLDVLVLSAGVPPSGTSIATTPLEVYDRTMAVNARGAFAALAHAPATMRAGGAIIAVSSAVTRSMPPNTAAYTASKAALEALTVVAARELGARDITVNSVSPGAVDTDALRAYQTPESTARIVGTTSLGRIGRGRDIAAVVAFLAGPDARWITGQNLRADGGRP